MTEPLTDQQIDEIEARASERRTALSGWLNCYSPLSEQGTLEDAEAVLEEDVPALVAEVRRQRDPQTMAIGHVEQTFAAELNDDRALILLDALIVLRSKLPCTCARSQGLHETGCRRYVPGHDLLSPALRLSRARAELLPADASA